MPTVLGNVVRLITRVGLPNVRLRLSPTSSPPISRRSEPMNPLERAAEAINRMIPYGCKTMPTKELARIVAEALFPKEPEPERIKAMASAIWPAFGHAEIGDGRAAYAAERCFMGLE